MRSCYTNHAADDLRQNCLFYPPRPKLEIARVTASLENLATDSEAREEMGKASRSLGEREFSRDLLVLRFCEWIEGHWNEKRTNLITHAF